ncbi:hypothetical protein Tco_1541935 [Tanacetum coccineum]
MRSPRVCRQHERVVGFEEASNMEGSRTRRNTEGNRPLEDGAEENRSQQKRFTKMYLAVHNIKQREGESVRDYATRTRNLVEHLFTNLPSTYKGLMEKTYTWIEAREVATNGAPNDWRDNFERSRKSSWDNGRGQKSRDRFSHYRGLVCA